MADNNYSLIPTTASSKKISNWDKPGGALGFFVAALAGCAALLGLYHILPWLIELTKNTITLVGLLAALAGLLWIITNKTFRETFSTVYFMVMRKIAGILIEIDPIAIVEHKLQEMRDKIQLINEQMGKIRGLITRNERRVEQKKAELEEELMKLAEYKKRPDKVANATVAERQVQRLRDAVARTEKRLTESRQWYEIMKKLKEHAKLVVEDTENVVEDRKEEYEAIKAQHAAFSSLMSVLKGNPNEMVNFTRAMDYMANDISFRLGEMSDVIDETGGLLDQIDVDNALTSARAAEILAQYEKGGIESLFESRDVKAIEGKRTDFGVTFTNTEEQDPVMVERNGGEKPEQKRTYFS